MSVPIVARIAPTALPPPSSPFGRTLTGRNAISDRSGSSSSSVRNCRNPPPMMASATSLSVAPCCEPIALSRVNSYCWVAKRRFRLILALRMLCGACTEPAICALSPSRRNWVFTNALARSTVELTPPTTDEPMLLSVRSPAANGLDGPAGVSARSGTGVGMLNSILVSVAVRVGRHAARQHPHRAVPVHEGVVDLQVEREAAAFETLDDVDLPRRAGQIEVIAVQPRDQDAEFAFVAWAGQCGAPDVVVEVEVVVDDPAVQGAVLQTWMGQLAVPRRDDLLPAGLVDESAQVIGRRTLGRRERQQPSRHAFSSSASRRR